MSVVLSDSAVKEYCRGIPVPPLVLLSDLPEIEMVTNDTPHLRVLTLALCCLAAKSQGVKMKLDISKERLANEADSVARHEASLKAIEQEIAATLELLRDKC
jgi:hypothetical protein